jgi:integrase
VTSISRRPGGQWRARYRDEAGREHARHFSRRVDGQRWLDEVTASVVTGAYVHPRAGRQTFSAYATAWSARQLWESTTAKNYALALRSTTFRDVPLARIRPSHLEAWVHAMTSSGLAPGTVRTRFANAHAVFRAAVRDRLIASDPADGIRLPRTRRRDVAMALPTAEQVSAILASADPHFRAFVALAAFAGLRLGEIAGTQVGDVDFVGRVLAVRRQVQRAPGGGVEIRPPKYGSERDVYLPDGLVAILGQHVERYRPALWIFEGNPGQPPHQNTVGYRWRKTCRAAGVDGVTLHDLRHWYASGLIAQGCDVVTVQRALGHSTASTTLDSYSHLWPTAEDRTRQAAAGLLASCGLSADSAATPAL